MSSARRSLLVVGLGVVACIELNPEPPFEDVSSGGKTGFGGTSGQGEAGESPDPIGSSGAAGQAQGGDTASGAGGVGAGAQPPAMGGAGTSAGSSSEAAGGVLLLGGSGGAAGDGGGRDNPPKSGGAAGMSTASGGSSGSGPTGGTSAGTSGAGGAGAGGGGAGTGGATVSHSDFSGGGPPDPNDRCGLSELSAEFSSQPLSLSGSLDAHDPAVISVDGRYYLFHTGAGIPFKTSLDLRTWSYAGRVYTANPPWISALIPGVGDLWAPDVSHFGGSYHLFYSASTFGSNRSCIGHATRDSLSSGAWFDRGPVICSNPGGGTTDDWNAIDPNLILDTEGVPWLVFGSFWSGIKLIKLDSSGNRADDMLHSIAARPGAEKAIEAPFITRRCGYYYLFVSFDYCCRGASSTYRQLVGRARNVLGPYLDRDGRGLLEGGGLPLVQGNVRWRGPGHNAILFVASRAYNIYHAYDSQNQGRPSLRIAELAFDMDAWPISGGP